MKATAKNLKEYKNCGSKFDPQQYYCTIGPASLSIMSKPLHPKSRFFIYVHKNVSQESLILRIEKRRPICYISLRKGESDVQMKYPAAHGMCIAGAGAANQNMQEDSAHRVDLA